MRSGGEQAMASLLACLGNPSTDSERGRQVTVALWAACVDGRLPSAATAGGPLRPDSSSCGEGLCHTPVPSITQLSCAFFVLTFLSLP